MAMHLDGVELYKSVADGPYIGLVWSMSGILGLQLDTSELGKISTYFASTEKSKSGEEVQDQDPC